MKQNVKNSESSLQGENVKKREKRKVSSTGGKYEKNVKNSKSPVPVLREMLRKKKRCDVPENYTCGIKRAFDLVNFFAHEVFLFMARRRRGFFGGI